jgi:WD40 repeat protein
MINEAFVKEPQETCDPDSQLAEMLIDAERFIRSSSWVIERFPLQTYCAALAFSPNSSSTKQLHWQDRMPLLKDVKGVRDDWDGCLQILEGHRKAVRAISFSPDGKVLASASSDKRVMIWDTSMGTIIRRLEGHSGSVLDVRFSPDNKFIASASSDRTVRIWDSETGAERMFLQKHNGIVRTLRFLPDCTGFVTSSRDNTVLRWDTAAASAEKIYDGEFSDINAAVLSPDGSRIAVALDEKVQVHSFPHGTHERTFAGNAGVVYELEFSPDGRILASSSHDNTIRLWYIKEDREVTLSGHSGAVFAVTFSADSQKLASTSSDRTIRLWDVEKASHVRTFEGHRDWVNAVAFSPDNKIIASCSHDKTVRLWDAKNIAMDVSPRTQSIRTIVFSPDGTKIALVLGNWSVQVWKPAQRVHLASIECESGIITSIAFSPNGKILATVSNDKIVRLYGTDKGDLQIKLDGRERHKRRVNAVAFAADGNLLASASNDKTVKIWNTSSSEAIRTLRGHEDWVTLVAFAPNSNIIASASSDKTVMLWNGTICFRKIKLFSIPGFLQFSEDSIDLNIGRQSMNVETGVPSTRLNGMDSAREMSLVGDWITRGGEKIMWLPSDYRPTCSAFHNEMGVLGQESGRLTILEFKID